MRLNFNEIITLSSSSLPPLYNSCFASICLADTWIKSGLIGQNVCQGSAAFICHVLVLIIMIGRIFDQDSYDKNSYVNIVMYYCKLDKHDGGLFYKFKIKSQWKISKKGWVSLATHRASFHFIQSSQLFMDSFQIRFLGNIPRNLLCQHFTI